jgi:7-cyano-7-deazaguanine reductase
MKQPLAHLTLGQPTDYPSHFDAGLLQAVPRQLNRSPIGIGCEQPLPFHGVDVWTGYELSWLNETGLPQVAVAELGVPCSSPNLIESKSFKLYLNSFNDSRWNHWAAVEQQLVSDLSHCAGSPVQLNLMTLTQAATRTIGELPGDSLDQQHLCITEYQYNPLLLAHAQQGQVEVEETLHSHLLKSNCLITNQPDWGSVVIKYRGQQIDRAALLRYIVAFRHHNEFHEQCVERIYMDIQQQLGPQQLTVYARYTRRGGLDINPFRSNFEQPPATIRLVRQ